MRTTENSEWGYLQATNHYHMPLSNRTIITEISSRWCQRLFKLWKSGSRMCPKCSTNPRKVPNIIWGERGHRFLFGQHLPRFVTYWNAISVKGEVDCRIIALWANILHNNLDIIMKGESKQNIGKLFVVFTLWCIPWYL